MFFLSFLFKLEKEKYRSVGSTCIIQLTSLELDVVADRLEFGGGCGRLGQSISIRLHSGKKLQNRNKSKKGGPVVYFTSL
jgi:hypothetical protein